MSNAKCPNCGMRTMEEHGTEPGDRHWWFCRNCGCQLYETHEQLHEQLYEQLYEVSGDADGA